MWRETLCEQHGDTDCNAQSLIVRLVASNPLLFLLREVRLQCTGSGNTFHTISMLLL